MALLIAFIILVVVSCGAQDEEIPSIKIIDNKNLTAGVIFAKEAEFYVSRTDYVLIHKVDTIHKYIASLDGLEAKIKPLLSIKTPVVPIPASVKHEVEHMIAEITTLRYLIHSIAMTAPSHEAAKHIRFRRSIPGLTPSTRDRDSKARLRSAAYRMALQVRSCAEHFTVPLQEKNTFLGRVLQDGPKATIDGKCYVTCFTPDQLDQANQLFSILEKAKYVEVPLLRTFNTSSKFSVLQNFYNLYDYLMDSSEITREMDNKESEFRFFYDNYVGAPYLAPIRKKSIKKADITFKLPVRNITATLFSFDSERLMSDQLTENSHSKNKSYRAPVMATIVISSPPEYHFFLNATTKRPSFLNITNPRSVTEAIKPVTKSWQDEDNHNLTLTTTKPISTTVTTQRPKRKVVRTTTRRPVTTRKSVKKTKPTTRRPTTTTAAVSTTLRLTTYSPQPPLTTPTPIQSTQRSTSTTTPMSTTVLYIPWISPSTSMATTTTTESATTPPSTTTSEETPWYENPFGRDFIPINEDAPPPSKLLRPTQLFAAIFEDFEEKEGKNKAFLQYFAQSWADAKKRRKTQTERRRRPTTPRPAPHLSTLESEFADPPPQQDEEPNLTRGKRALLPIGGTLLRGLFGTLTLKDKQQIEKAIQEMASSQADIVQVVKAQAAVINVTSTSAKMSEINIQRITKILALVQTTITNMNQTSANASVIRNFHMDLAATLRELHGVLESVRSDIRAFLTAWDSLLQGRLPPYLVSPTQLAKVLNKMPIPEGLQLPLKTLPENMHQYYNLITTSPVHDGAQLYINYHVPLISNAKMYDLFRVLPWPVQINNSNIYAFYKTEYSYIAVSKDRQSHINLEKSQLHNCRGEGIRICSPAAPIFRAPMQSCAFALYMSQEEQVQAKCMRMLIKDPPPRFYGGPQGRVWAYSVTKPLRLEIFAGSGLPIPNAKAIKISGAGILEIPANTMAIANGITLVAEATYYYRLESSDFDNFVIPNFPNTPVLASPVPLDQSKSELTISIEQLMNSSANSDLLSAKTEQQIKDMLNAAKSLTVKEYFSKVTNNTWLIVGLVSVIVLILGGIFIYCYYIQGSGSLSWMTALCCAAKVAKPGLNIPVNIPLISMPPQPQQTARPIEVQDRQMVVYAPRQHTPRYEPTDDAVY